MTKIQDTKTSTSDELCVPAELPESVQRRRRPAPKASSARAPLSAGVVETKRQIPLHQLHPSPRFAMRRKTEALHGEQVLPKAAVQDLVDSYKALGRQHTPLMVMPSDARMRTFEIICGHRRFSAHHWRAEDEGLRSEDVQVNCTVFENLPEEEAFDLVYSENKDRQDINPWEKLQAVWDMEQREVARERILLRMGWSSPTMIKKTLRIVRNCTPELQTALEAGLSFSSAFCIVEQAIEDEAFPKEKLRRLIEQAQKGLSQTQIQKRIEQLKSQSFKVSIEPVKVEVKEGKNQKRRFSLSFDPSKNSMDEVLEIFKTWQKQIKEASKAYEVQTIQKRKARSAKLRERTQAAKTKKLEKAKALEASAKEEAQKAEQEVKAQERRAIEAIKNRRVATAEGASSAPAAQTSDPQEVSS